MRFRTVLWCFALLFATGCVGIPVERGRDSSSAGESVRVARSSAHEPRADEAARFRMATRARKEPPPLTIAFSEEEHQAIQQRVAAERRARDERDKQQFGRILTEGEREEVDEFGRLLTPEERIHLSELAQEEARLAEERGRFEEQQRVEQEKLEVEKAKLAEEQAKTDLMAAQTDLLAEQNEILRQRARDPIPIIVKP